METLTGFKSPARAMTPEKGASPFTGFLRRKKPRLARGKAGRGLAGLSNPHGMGKQADGFPLWKSYPDTLRGDLRLANKPDKIAKDIMSGKLFLAPRDTVERTVRNSCFGVGQISVRFHFVSWLEVPGDWTPAVFVRV